jgi:arylsulfatase A-like enzyme
MNRKSVISLFLIVLFVTVLVAILFRNNLGDLLHSSSNNPIKNSAMCSDCNVVFIAYDALQASHVSHLGYEKKTTPVMDAIAGYGSSFQNAVSVAPWTVPSYMSIFTGLYPSEHKLVNKYTTFTKENQIIANLKNLSPQTQTLAQVLKNNGYVTGGFTGDAGVGSMFGYNQGFDIYTDEKTFGSVENSADHALTWLKANKDKKFFLFLHGYDSHGQFQIGANYQGQFLPKDYKGIYTGAPAEQSKLREQGLDKGEVNLSTDDISFWRGMYDSKIFDADARVGKFMDEFDKLDLNKKTIFVIFADHGTEIFEHNRIDHGFSLYDELLHVPLVFVVPGMPEGRKIDSQVSTLDIAPTIINILGLNPGDQFASQIRGESLVPFLQGKSIPAKDIFSETDYRDYTHKRSIRTHDGWKYILTLENNLQELYDLNSDPTEKNNLVSQNPAKTAELDNLLKKHLIQMGTKLEGPWTIGCLPVYGDQCKIDLTQPKRPSEQVQEYF